MANHASAVKQHRQSVVRNSRNRSIRSELKTLITKFEGYVKDENRELSYDFFKVVQSKVMKSITKGVTKKNTASRIVSRLSRLMKSKFEEGSIEKKSA